jgi:methylmalonyl-CoA mutase
LYYETLKHTGEYPIVGVNTFLNSKGSPTLVPGEVIRSTEEEKQFQIQTIEILHKLHEGNSSEMLSQLQKSAVENKNLFAELMEICKICSLGQITESLFNVGGQYRRNM